MTETTTPSAVPDTEGQPAAAPETPPGQYWLRVHGYPVQIGEELIAYGDCFDPRTGPVGDDPSHLINSGDIIVYYADGPATVYGVGRVAGPVELAAEGETGGRWRVRVEPEASIMAMNKAPHAVGLEPPSGWHFLWAVRDYTFIRLPDGDGPYLVEQVKARASKKGD